MRLSILAVSIILFSIVNCSNQKDAVSSSSIELDFFNLTETRTIPRTKSIGRTAYTYSIECIYLDSMKIETFILNDTLKLNPRIDLKNPTTLKGEIVSGDTVIVSGILSLNQNMKIHSFESLQIDYNLNGKKGSFHKNSIDLKRDLIGR